MEKVVEIGKGSKSNNNAFLRADVLDEGFLFTKKIIDEIARILKENSRFWEIRKK